MLSIYPTHSSRLPSVSQTPFELRVFRQVSTLNYGHLSAIVYKISQNSQRVRLTVPLPDLVDPSPTFDLAHYIHRPRVLEDNLYQTAPWTIHP